MIGRIDLHVHSLYSSDGDYPPAELIQLAKRHELTAIAISDHDTTAAYPEALRLGKEAGIEVIPSIELTTLFEEREFHLLLPFVNYDSPVLAYLCAQVRDGRLLEAQERVEKLKQLGIDITWEEVKEEAGPYPPLGVTIAQILLKKAQKAPDESLAKYFEKNNILMAPYIFYKDFFMEGKPAFVERRNISLLDVLEVVPQTHGLPILAHPGASFQQVTKEDLQRLKAFGLLGIEVYTSYHNEEKTRFYLELAQELDLVPTVGSDFHGSIKPHIPFGSIKAGGYWMVEELKQRRPK